MLNSSPVKYELDTVYANVLQINHLQNANTGNTEDGRRDTLWRMAREFGFQCIGRLH